MYSLPSSMQGQLRDTQLVEICHNIKAVVGNIIDYNFGSNY